MVKKEDLISVIVPVYNVEKYLKKCIDSILEQDYTKLEIFLVDDGSTDNSGHMCDEYAKKDSRIKVIHKINGGLSDARNVALDRASGTYVVFIDSDDYVEKNYISFLYYLAITYEADISICNFKYVNAREEFLNRFEDTEEIVSLKRKEAISQLLDGNNINTSASMKLYRLDMFCNIRYPKGKLYEDIAVTYKLFLKADKLVYGNKALYVYLCRSGSITKQKFTVEKLDAILNIKGMCADIAKEFPELRDKCQARVFSQYVTIYSAVKMSGSDRKLEKKLFADLSKIRKSKELDKKMKMYSLLAGMGKFTFDLCIQAENYVQNRRKL